MHKIPIAKIPIAKPTLAGDELQRFAGVLESGWVSQGPLVQQFEEAIAAYTQAPYTVAMTSWTTAMHAGLLILGIGPGDEVICPSYSFIATANVIRHAGAAPRFVDIDPATLNLDPDAVIHCIETQYTSALIHKKSGGKLKAIQLVHQVGIPGDIDRFADIAKRYNLILIEDSACALGSTYQGKPIGASGFMGALSFHPRKVITTGEGGMLLLPREDWAVQAKMLRTHGMDTSDVVRHQAGSTLYEQYPVVGYNYKMTDLQAALGLSQLAAMDPWIQRRMAIRQQYDAAFAELPEISTIKIDETKATWNAQSYPIRLIKGNQSQRDAVMTALDYRGISTRRGIPPSHLEPAYATGDHLPHTEAVSDTSLFIPIYPTLTDADVQQVISGVKDTLHEVGLSNSMTTAPTTGTEAAISKTTASKIPAGKLQTLLSFVLLMSLVMMLNLSTLLPALAAEMPWNEYTWVSLGEQSATGQDGKTALTETHSYASDSLQRLSHQPGMRSFFLKVTFDPPNETDDGAPYDTEIADMFLNCELAQLDVLSVYRYFQNMPTDQQTYRQEKSVYINPNTFQANVFKAVCPDFMDRLVNAEQRKHYKGSMPWR